MMEPVEGAVMAGQETGTGAQTRARRRVTAVGTGLASAVSLGSGWVSHPDLRRPVRPGGLLADLQLACSCMLCMGSFSCCDGSAVPWAWLVVGARPIDG